ncbi:hypothetical protein OF83DRAFT_1177199 [Amylostereum chailletii]|nr:hypothetical protein OF83DRAFT_1177199 [Amylostereum chailletii]
MSPLSTGLPRAIHKPALTVPGTTSDSKETVECLLEQDREAYSCFYGPVPFHNHLSHHLLAAYDLGASPSLLQAIYDKDAPELRPIAAEHKGETIEAQDVKVNSGNWREYLGQEIYYPNFLEFFSEEIKRLGGAGAYEYWVFSKDANDQGAYMTERFIGGALHPLIQMGYAIEFSSDAMIAQALAQTAVHRPYFPNLFSWNVPNDETTATESSHPLLSILAAAYESNILTPVLPYDPDALLTQRTQDALTPERQAEIRRLIACWVPSVLSVRTPEVLTNKPDLDELELKDKARELVFFATLLFAGTGRRGLDPRLDFFLMHVLTSSLFVVPLAAILTAPASRARLLSSYLGATLAILLVRGRPRIDPELLMQYTATPVPPSQRSQPETLKVADPWTTMLPHALAARDAHTVKAFRVLYAAAQRYGNIDRDYLCSHGGHRGEEKVDGSVFVRAAGVLLDVMGWVGPGGDGKEGTWDRSALGWDGAWAEEMRMKGLLSSDEHWRKDMPKSSVSNVSDESNSASILARSNNKMGSWRQGVLPAIIEITGRASSDSVINQVLDFSLPKSLCDIDPVVYETESTLHFFLTSVQASKSSVVIVNDDPLAMNLHLPGLAVLFDTYEQFAETNVNEANQVHPFVPLLTMAFRRGKQPEYRRRRIE